MLKTRELQVFGEADFKRYFFPDSKIIAVVVGPPRALHLLDRRRNLRFEGFLLNVILAKCWNVTHYFADTAVNWMS